jgi:hypothetical protein
VKLDVDRCIVGLATCYDVPSLDNGRVWSREQFRTFVDLETAVPLRLNHGPLISHSGVIAYIGKAVRFAHVTYPVPGLLCLAVLDKDSFGYNDELLADLANLGDLIRLPSCWGLSIGGLVSEDQSIVWPHEISIVHQPAYEDARIFAVGPTALDYWQTLTEPVWSDG